MFDRYARDDEAAQRQFTRRAALLGALQIAGFGALAARLYQLQVLEDARYAPLADSNRLTTHRLIPIRGLIYDVAGRVLADNEENFRLILTPSLAGDVAQVLDRCAKVVMITPEQRQKALVRARRQARKEPIVVRETLTYQEVARLNVLAPHLPGIETDLIGQRRYYHGRPMSQVVGYVGAVQRYALDDDPVLRMPGMRVGLLGVEKGMEKRLRGTGGYIKREVDARGRIVRDLARHEPERGKDVVLTIDTELQEKILQRLSRVRRGAVVAIDVASGGVVAMASWPSADASAVGEGISEKAWRKLSGGRGNPLFNRTIQGLYPPGSTFKMVTALAALRHGEITPRERVVCRGAYHLGGKRFRCWKRSGHGPMNLHEAIKQSCDVYFYEIARRVGIEQLAQMARDLGFGQTYDQAGIALQKAGVVPDPAWKLTHLSQPWYGGETLLAGIGQGFVTTTPLQLAVMMARLASGKKVIPSVVQTDEMLTSGPQRFDALNVKTRDLRAVQRALAAVVATGTGKKAALDGISVAGKTGTAQVARVTSYRSQLSLPWRQRDHALFVSYVPAEKPRFAVSVIVEHGMSGGKAAAPLARDIMKILLDFAPTPARRTFQIGKLNTKSRG